MGGAYGNIPVTVGGTAVFGTLFHGYGGRCLGRTDSVPVAGGHFYDD